MRHISEIVRDRQPVTLSPKATVKHACQCMRDRRVGAVLVTDKDHRLAGIFTGRDALCRALSDAAETTLGEVMTGDPCTMPPATPAIEALRLMRDGDLPHVPVVAGGKVVGVASHGDFRGLEHARLDEETGLWERI